MDNNLHNTEQFIEALSKEIKPSKTTKVLPIFLRWLSVCVVYIVVMLYIFGLRSDLSLKFSEPLFVAEITILALMVVAMAVGATILSFPDMLQKKWILLFTPISVVAFIITLFLAYLGSTSEVSPLHGIECLLCISMFSLLPAVWLFILLKKQASTHQQLLGSVAMLAATSLGALSLRLSEKTDSVTHLLLWHYLPMIGFALLGAWLGKKFLKW